MIKYISFFLLFIATLYAHDIGVAQAKLEEINKNHYRLHVQVGLSMQTLYAEPILPSKCKFTTVPGGRKSFSTIDYEFLCEEALLSEDELFLPWQREGVLLNSEWLDGSKSNRFFAADSGGISVLMADLNAGSGSLLMVAKRYVLLGIEHILEGYDHLLFVLCLLLLVNGTMLLIKTITAFTLAHSITLGLATLGFVNMPIAAVEASIALSIAFLAAEIIRSRLYGVISLSEKKPWLVAFGFGLLHGLGFASALSALGLPEKEVISALLFFNAGVEMGQLVFIFSVLIFLFIFKKVLVQKRKVVVSTVSSLIGVLAMYWFIQRALPIFIS